jgi:pectate lyase
MARRRWAVPLAAATATVMAATGAGLGTAAAVGTTPGVAGAADLGRQVLGESDGWGAANGGTTGGSTADDEHVFVVDTWEELRAALGDAGARTDTTPRIVYVDGVIDAFAGTSCEAIAATVPVAGAGGTFSMADYVAAYDPATYGWVDPVGPLEDARVAAAAEQAKVTLQHVGSNVTIVGLGDDARVVGASLRVRDARNVIVRNLTFSDARDCFPAWDPGDGDAGNWNSAYDNVSVWTSENVWVDHSTFDDGEHPPSSLPVVFGRPFEIHDGLLDITHGSDHVTVSYNHFADHDKTAILGSSDSRTQDAGKHKVTYHHNRWTDVGQRAPRVRFGDVHVYNELYEQTREGIFQYYWGAGVDSSIYAENNAFELAAGVDPARVVGRYKGEQLFETGSTVNGEPVDLVGAYNASVAESERLEDAARWSPTRHGTIDPTWAVPAIVRSSAGAGRLGPVDAPAYDAGATYGAGDVVVHDGALVRAQWYAHGTTPGSTWGPWEELAVDERGLPVWASSRVFRGGDAVVHDGAVWVAQWWTRGQEPGAEAWGPFRRVV